MTGFLTAGYRIIYSSGLLHFFWLSIAPTASNGQKMPYKLLLIDRRHPGLKVIFNTSAVDSELPSDRQWCDR
ncbi:hypothetical protein [Microcoleus sp. CAWBG58]|uniref:hypothetical protein n=1 Tax=Microcoleus sp. CAWBG58 TaxID=2841651 RepID=UPI0025F1815C|nr:hypothetical protein [Microcoleus sp. CAWBG58]